jgi:hypothetical protein
LKLIDQVFALCKKKLVGNGWDTLLKGGHGLDIDQPNAKALAAELARTTLHIKRTIPGFEDFAPSGRCGIESGSPARSLLYHALASPNVLVQPDGKRLGYFPTWAEIEAVENYVFGVRPPTIDSLLSRAATKQLTVVVFACEYRPAGQTAHQRHADMVYARTGIARVGTAAPNYRPDLRGFVPETDASAFAICVSPARYAAYLAVPKAGSAAEFRPMRFRDKKSHTPGDSPDWVPDDQRSFWTPVHKLFAGDECLAGMTLKVDFTVQMLNEKIYRLHKKVLNDKAPDAPPFRIREHIAAFADPDDHGTGVLIPEPHAHLVEKATLADGSLVTFTVPPGDDNKDFDTFSSTSKDPPNATRNSGEFRQTPEYVHARTLVKNGAEVDLNTLDDKALTKQLAAGNYQALHYVDFTGDGWVQVEVRSKELAKDDRVVNQPVAAYTLVTAPDFFPGCDQREMTEWTEITAPQALRDQIWNIPPDTLCDQRLAPNLQLPDHPFADDDFTMTALVSLLGPVPNGPVLRTRDTLRHSHLADDAAGVFSPGWDVSRDWTKVGSKVVWHMAAYGLGSPFPEDAKLCAALSTFWPAVAPDVTREMEPIEGNQSGTVSPLTDEEIGQVGGLPWDGVQGPQLIIDGGQAFVEYANFRHVDYVRNALNDLFTLRLTARVDSTEYQQRVLAMAFAYLAVGAERTGNQTTPVRLADFRDDQGKRQPGERRFWKLISFRLVSHGTPELELAQQQAQTTLPGDVYRFALLAVALDANGKPTNGPVLDAPNFLKKRIAVTRKFLVFVDPVNQRALVKEQSETAWRKGILLV